MSLDLHETADAFAPPVLSYSASDGAPSARTGVAIVLLFAVAAFTLRAGAIFALHRWDQPNAIEHRVLALSLVESGAFYFRDFNYYGPSSVQSPPYPFLLATLFKIFGPDTTGAYVAAMLINSIAGALTVWMTWKLVNALGGTRRAAVIAAALVAIWPSQVYAATHVQAISLITLCFVTLMYFFQRSMQTGRAAPWACFSLVGTLAALTEPVLLPIVALSGLLVFFWPSAALTRSSRIRNAAILLGAAMIVLVPWSARNRTVHGKWVPIKSTFWVNVWKANNEYATGTDRLELSEQKQAALSSGLMLSDQQIVDPKFDHERQYDRLTPEQRARLERQPEAVREEVFKDFATTWIAANPGRYFQLCLARLGKTVWVDWDNPKAHSIFFWLPRTAMLLLLIPGMVVAFRQRWSLCFAGLLVASCLLTYSLTITAARFSLPLEPLALCIVSGFLALTWKTRAVNP
jgi:hypothetical protein